MSERVDCPHCEGKGTVDPDEPGGARALLLAVPGALWHEGEPANLAAAAEDALEWLRFLRRNLAGTSTLAQENRTRVGRCIAALEAQLAAAREETDR